MFAHLLLRRYHVVSQQARCHLGVVDTQQPIDSVVTVVNFVLCKRWYYCRAQPEKSQWHWQRTGQPVQSVGIGLCACMASLNNARSVLLLLAHRGRLDTAVESSNGIYELRHEVQTLLGSATAWTENCHHRPGTFSI